VSGGGGGLRGFAPQAQLQDLHVVPLASSQRAQGEGILGGVIRGWFPAVHSRYVALVPDLVPRFASGHADTTVHSLGAVRGPALRTGTPLSPEQLADPLGTGSPKKEIRWVELHCAGLLLLTASIGDCCAINRKAKGVAEGSPQKGMPEPIIPDVVSL
jgi:hypothetical protein